jgi:hypothetical protein
MAVVVDAGTGSNGVASFTGHRGRVVVGVAVLVVGAGVIGNSAARSAIGSCRVHAKVRSNPAAIHTLLTTVDARCFILVADRVAGMLAAFP